MGMGDSSYNMIQLLVAITALGCAYPRLCASGADPAAMWARDIPVRAAASMYRLLLGPEALYVGPFALDALVGSATHR